MGLRRRVMEEVLVHRRMHKRNLSYTCQTPEGLADRERLLFEHIVRSRRAVR